MLGTDLTELRNSIQRKDAIFFTVQELLLRYPPTAADRLDRGLLALAGLSKKLGEWLTLDPRKDHPLLFAQDADEMRFLISGLVELSFVDVAPFDFIDQGQPGQLWLSLRGWGRVADLQRGQVGRRPGQVFVAMDFRDELSGLYEEAIKPGIEDAGYTPVRIDGTDYTGGVVDQIFAEIRSSRLVVADFCYQNRGVYEEAGFAHGLGIPVINICHDDFFQRDSESAEHRPHFDKAHENHIIYKTNEELRERLKNRILGVFGPPVIE